MLHSEFVLFRLVTFLPNQLARHWPKGRTSEELTGESYPQLFQCGKRAAHRLCGAATTTAGRKPMRQCFADGSPRKRLASDGVRFVGRIVKKLTKPKGSNRPGSRVPYSDEPSFIRDVAKERTVSSPFAQRPRITGI